ncbi:MAG: glycosyltransferase family 4 protein [Sphingobacteriaceae bacterium]|nr:glycosyltransferase family 4 protein [Sphingobacteriaceae bacterium]
MPETLIYLIIFFSLFLFELFYFRIAVRYTITDEPNHRSSHQKVTIRGGGIIFPLAGLAWLIYSDFSLPAFIAGLLLIAIISFIDDLGELKSSIRLLFHILAISLLICQIKPDIEWYSFPLVVILIVGAVNAYNFMDGINGITGGYSLILLVSLFYVNHFVVSFISESLLIFIILSLLVFNFFNFRKAAKCFAGDVGSVSVAFVICFLLCQLIFKTQNLLFIVLLLIYGLDAVTTIVFRLIRKENILKAHRSHFYQYLANERKWQHLVVSGLYMLIQLVLNIILLTQVSEHSDFEDSLYVLLPLLLFTGILFILMRIIVEGKSRLFGIKEVPLEKCM